MNLEKKLISEISQREKVTYHMISLKVEDKNNHKQTHRDRDWIGGYQRESGKGGGEEGRLGTCVWGWKRVKGVIRHMFMVIDYN